MPANNPFVKIDRTITWGNIGSVVATLAIFLIFLIRVGDKVEANEKALSENSQWHKNIAEVMTAHTTQIALTAADVDDLDKREDRLNAFMIETARTLDELRILMIEGN